MKRIVAERKVAHVLIVVFGLLGVALLIWYVWPDQALSTAEANKTIEIQAAQEKNPAKCNTIRGESYTYNSEDQKVVIDEAQAKVICEQNIVKDIIPVL